MLPRSLQWRLVSFFCLIIFCLMVPVWFYLNSRIENEYYDKFIDRINIGLNNCKISSDFTAEELKNEVEAGKDFFQLNLEYRSYTITDKYGEIYFTNDTNLDNDLRNNPESALNSLLTSDNFVQAMSGIEKNRKILETYGSESFFDYAKPVGTSILYFRYYKDDWEEIISSFNSVIFTSIILGLVISFIAGYLLSMTITVPLVKLMHKAKSVAAGDFDQLLEVRSDDEIGKLTDSFNFMASSLKNTLAEISSEKSKMETILNYMTDGIIAFNLKGEVIHTNPASAHILGVEGEIESFEEYSKRFGIDYRIEDVTYLQTHQTTETSLDVNGKSIKVYFAVFTDESKKPGGVIAVLQDITEQQRLENMRKEFVANVSHELRTPLTSIKSYSETLLDGALEDREMTERFLGVINSEADRMTRLVKDLLQLSRLDNQQLRWNFEELSLVDLVKSAAERMELEAKAHNQVLECFVLGDIPAIEADYGRLEQVVFNILSNALKYTPGEGRITVYVGKIYNDVYFKVTDNGIGIPENDLSRIFERFYRVDKARSREMGGTGLGLSIAKEIVEAHGGVITISSKVGNGTEVMARLPIKQTELVSR